MLQRVIGGHPRINARPLWRGISTNSDAGAPSPPFVAIDTPVVAVTHVRLVDGTGSPAQTIKTVVIQGDRIMAVG